MTLWGETMKRVHILKSAVGISLSVVFTIQVLAVNSGIKVFAADTDMYSDYLYKNGSAENASVNVPINVLSFCRPPMAFPPRMDLFI